MSIVRAPALLQAETDETQAADSHAEEQQIVFLLCRVPAFLSDTEVRPK